MVVVLILFLLTGCSAMGEWLSGPAGNQLPQLVYPAQFANLRIGETTQAKVRAVFGAPTDLQNLTKNQEPVLWLHRDQWGPLWALGFSSGFGGLGIHGLLSLLE